jgi:pyridoxine 5-phosphate synthase
MELKMGKAREHVRLGVNVDHVATVRNARGGQHPSPVAAALLAQKAGADGITAHLREDRRHMRDDDMFALKDVLSIPLNFEMAATQEMLQIALDVKPHACCLVPERRAELTTEGGLDAAGAEAHLWSIIDPLKAAGIRVSLFIDADEAQVKAARHLEADIVELHTGTYCHVAQGETRDVELARLVQAAQYAHDLGLEVHAGHGLCYETVGAVAAIVQMRELNIGHFLIGQAIQDGLALAIQKMRSAINAAR